MKRLTSIILTLCSLYSFGQYSFNNSTTGQSENITAFSFATDNVRGIAVGNNGTVFKSLDEGVTWAQQGLIPTENGLAFSSNVVGCQVFSLTDGILATQLGQIFKSTDSWVNWTSVHNGDNNNQITDVAYTQSGRFICSRANGDILYTDDEGASWDSLSLVGVTTTKGIDFHETSGLGVAVGLGGSASRSTDNGNTWSAITIGASAQLNDVAVANASYVVVVGNGGVIYRSTDGGNNWVLVNSPVTEDLKRIDMYSNHGLIVGANGVVLETDDWGATWVENTTHSFSNTESVFSVITMNSFKACIGGVSGKVDYAPAVPYAIEFVPPWFTAQACVGVPFEFTFSFTNVGPSDAVNPTFNTLCNGNSIFVGSSITHFATVTVGDTVTVTFPSVYFGNQGVYPVWLYAVDGSDIYGFNTSDYFLEAGELDPYDITADGTFCLGDTIQLEVNNGLSYEWYGANFVDPTFPNQEVVPQQDMTYYVDIQQTDCKIKDSVVMTIDVNCFIDTSVIDTTETTFAGNYAFSPNNDGVNDVLEFDFINVNAVWNSVSIYNRWGDEVYFTTNYNNEDRAWDGMFNERRSTPGTYFFVAQTSDKGTFTGWIQLVR